MLAIFFRKDLLLQPAYDEIPVFSISDLTFTENVGIIISVSWELQDEIKKELERRGFHEYILYE